MTGVCFYRLCHLYENKMYCVQENQRWVAAVNDSPKPPSQRITLTFPVLLNARCVIFVACGSSKAEIVKVSMLTVARVKYFSLFSCSTCSKTLSIVCQLQL